MAKQKKAQATTQRVTAQELDAVLLDAIIARLAAADTIRTTERPETVFARAIDEGILAASLIKARFCGEKPRG